MPEGISREQGRTPRARATGGPRRVGMAALLDATEPMLRDDAGGATNAEHDAAATGAEEREAHGDAASADAVDTTTTCETAHPAGATISAPPATGTVLEKDTSNEASGIGVRATAHREVDGGPAGAGDVPPSARAAEITRDRTERAMMEGKVTSKGEAIAGGPYGSDGVGEAGPMQRSCSISERGEINRASSGHVVKTSIRLREDVSRLLRMLALGDGVALADLVRGALDRELGRRGLPAIAQIEASCDEDYDDLLRRAGGRKASRASSTPNGQVTE